MTDIKSDRSYIDIYLLLARLLFANGASVERIRRSVDFLHKYFTGEEIHIFVAYDAIMITDIKGEIFRTKIDRSRGFAGTNLAILREINDMLSRLNDEKPCSEDIYNNLLEISKIKPGMNKFIYYCLWGLAGVVFSLLNNSDLISTVSAFVTTFLISFLRDIFLEKGYNLYASTIIGVVIASMLNLVILSVIPTNTMWVILVAAVLPFIPGASLINGGMDILMNHNSVGVARMTYSFMMIAVLTLGISIPAGLFQNFIHPELPMRIPAMILLARDAVCGCLSAVVFALLFNAPRNTLWAFAVSGLTARTIRTIFVLNNMDIVTSALIAVAVVSVASCFLYRYHRLPSGIFGIICVFCLLPGYNLITALHNMIFIFQNNASDISYLFLITTVQLIVKAFAIIFVLIAGIVLPVLIYEGQHNMFSTAK